MKYLLLLNAFFLVGAKFFIKHLYKIISEESAKQVNVLIYGAGNSGIITYEAIVNSVDSNINVVGFIDDNESKISWTNIAQFMDTYLLQYPNKNLKPNPYYNYN